MISLPQPSVALAHSEQSDLSFPVLGCVKPGVYRVPVELYEHFSKYDDEKILDVIAYLFDKSLRSEFESFGSVRVNTTKWLDSLLGQRGRRKLCDAVDSCPWTVRGKSYAVGSRCKRWYFLHVNPDCPPPKRAHNKVVVGRATPGATVAGGPAVCPASSHGGESAAVSSASNPAIRHASGGCVDIVCGEWLKPALNKAWDVLRAHRLEMRYDQQPERIEIDAVVERYARQVLSKVELGAVDEGFFEETYPESQVVSYKRGNRRFTYRIFTRRDQISAFNRAADELNSGSPRVTWDEAGRFYHPLTSLNRVLRARCRIAGEEMANVDLSSCFWVFLVAGMEEGDERRQLVKCLESGTLYRNFRRMIEDDPDAELGNPDDLKPNIQKYFLFSQHPNYHCQPWMAALRRHYPALGLHILQARRENKGASGFAKYLMSLESSLFVEKVFVDAANNGFTPIPLHDGFMVPKSQGVAFHSMVTAYVRDAVGFDARVKLDG